MAGHPRNSGSNPEHLLLLPPGASEVEVQAEVGGGDDKATCEANSAPFVHDGDNSIRTCGHHC